MGVAHRRAKRVYRARDDPIGGFFFPLVRVRRHCLFSSRLILLINYDKARGRKIIKILLNNRERIEQMNTHAADDKRSSHFLSLFFSFHAFIHSLSSLIYRVARG